MQQKGSAAYDIARFEQSNEPRMQMLPKNKKTVKQLNIVKVIFYMIIIVALLCAMIYGRVVQLEVDAQLAVANNQLSILKAENSRLQIQMESMVSIDKIEEIATGELGLNKVTSQQIEYINISKENKIKVSGSKTMLDTIMGWLNK